MTVWPACFVSHLKRTWNITDIPTHHFKQLFHHSRMQWSKFLQNLYIKQLNWGITMIRSITSLKLCIAVKIPSRFNTVDPKPCPCRGRRHSSKTEISGSYYFLQFPCIWCKVLRLHRMICQRNYQQLVKVAQLWNFRAEVSDKEWVICYVWQKQRKTHIGKHEWQRSKHEKRLSYHYQNLELPWGPRISLSASFLGGGT
jgi:hypothetical protein